MPHSDVSASCAACTVLNFSLWRGFTIISAPAFKRTCKVLKASLKTRLVRLRTTAGPNFLDTTTANRAGPLGRTWHHNVSPLFCTLWPAWIMVSKSVLKCRRNRRGRPLGNIAYARISSWRPFWRRALNTLRPPAVAIRARKPMCLARLLLLGL